MYALRSVRLVNQIDLDHLSRQQIAILADNAPTGTQTTAHLLLFYLLLGEGLLQELPYGFLFDANRLITRRGLISHFIRHGIGVRNQLASVSIYIVFGGFGPGDAGDGGDVMSIFDMRSGVTLAVHSYYIPA